VRSTATYYQIVSAIEPRLLDCRPAVRFGFSDVMDGASELILDLLVATHQKFHLIVCPGRRRGIAP